MINFGFLNNLRLSNPTPNVLSSIGGTVTPVRVINTILTSQDIKDYYQGDLYPLLNEDVVIGSVIFADLQAPIKDENSGGLNVARPLFPNTKNVPLKKEVVLILSTTTNNLVDTVEQKANTNKFVYYYISPLNIWGNLNHNALPEEIYFPETPDNLNKSYSDTLNGDVNSVNNEFHEIELGTFFKERGNIQPLQPYEGDIIYEGRWGNSLRFGSTSLGTDSPWSEFPENGDPITIIRNGFYDNGKEPWDPIVEDINQDKSSLYLTSTQKIPIEVANQDYSSYIPSTEPTNPKDYTQDQVIITSNRILINSKNDHTLLSGAKSIGLNSKESVNIYAGTDFIVKTKGKILLGDPDESKTQSLLLGDKTVNLLSNLLIDLQTLSVQLSSLTSLPPGVPFMPLNAAAISVNLKLQNYQSQLSSLLSKVSKTK
jgi:hypothetical protein